MSLNKVMLIGHLGRDPEMKKLPSGVAATNISLATNTVYKDKNGEKQKSTEWHRVTLYRRTAEVVGEYCKKGDMIYVEGTLQYRKYTDKQNIERYVTDIVGNKITFLVNKTKLDGGNQRFEDKNMEEQNKVTFVDNEDPPVDKSMNEGSFGNIDEEDVPF